jgi:hypothetical protein
MSELTSLYITADLTQDALDRIAEVGSVAVRSDHTRSETDTSFLGLCLGRKTLIERLLDYLAIGDVSTVKSIVFSSNRSSGTPTVAKSAVGRSASGTATSASPRSVASKRKSASQ